MNYDQVRQAVSGYLHRNDQETIDNEPVAIELAREKLSRDFFPESAAVLVQDLPIVAGVGLLPTDFGQADTVSVAGYGDLDYETPRAWARMLGNKDTYGKFSISGDKLLVGGPLAFVNLLYYRTPPLIGPGGTSWLSADYPDVWVWMAIAEQHRFVQDFESAQFAEEYAYDLAGKAVFRTRANRGGGGIRMVTRR